MSGTSPQHPAVGQAQDDERDGGLMSRIHNGDGSALEDILQLYWAPLVAYVTRILNGRDAAEDVVQETFIRLWDRRAQWAPTESLKSFLYSIARNLALNEQRSRGVRARWLLKSEGRRGQTTPMPTDLAEANELGSAVDRGIASLPERRREVFILARFHDMSYRQIAEVMGISPQTVANQMSAALADLRESLKAFLNDSATPPLKLVRSAHQAPQYPSPGVAL